MARQSDEDNTTLDQGVLWLHTFKVKEQLLQVMFMCWQTVAYQVVQSYYLQM